MAADTPFLLKRPHAQLDWRETGPVARGADDIYFSVESGFEEARSVFLAGAGFPQRFNADLTVVAELGFGTGLNFLVLWDAFREHAPKTARLHFISVEGFPLTRPDAQRALSAFDEVKALSAALIDTWPSPHKGAHRRNFEGGRVTLTILHDEVAEALALQDFSADAWFLDGFAPAKNPEMWQPAVFREMARLSKPGAPAATFTVAGMVRRGLAQAGFDVAKKPGFGRKRERLEAIYAGPVHKSDPAPLAPGQPLEGRLAIIGGGIAAASLSYALRQRGRTFDVFARGGWAAGASSAPQGLLTPRLEAADRPHARALLNAFDYAAWLYGELGVLHKSGALRAGDSSQADKRLQALSDQLDERYAWLDASVARERMGCKAGPGLWMSHAGYFDPAHVVRALAGDTPAHAIEIVDLKKGRDGWRLITQDGEERGPYAGVILAGGHELGALCQLPIEAGSGRLAVFKYEHSLAAPLAWGGYASPFKPGQLLVGATHRKSAEIESEEASEAELRVGFENGPLTLDAALGERVIGWGGVRAAVADRLPVCGPLPEANFDQRWQGAARGGLRAPDGPASLDRAGLFVLGALGARGFAHAPLLAETLVSMMCGEPAGLDRGALEAFHPARFAWRALKRGR